MYDLDRRIHSEDTDTVAFPIVFSKIRSHDLVQKCYMYLASAGTLQPPLGSFAAPKFRLLDFFKARWQQVLCSEYLLRNAPLTPRCS